MKETEHTECDTTGEILKQKEKRQGTDTIGTKVCSKCKNEVLKSKFSPHKRSADKLSYYCYDCFSVIAKKNYNKYRLDRINYQKKRRRYKKNNELCSFCGKPKLKNSVMCERCWFRRISKRHFGTCEKWEFLKELAEKQNYKCSYTDEKLILGVNMSLDHIISNYDNPSLKTNLDNIQWVTRDINLIKNKLSHESFLSLCKSICKKFKLV